MSTSATERLVGEEESTEILDIIIDKFLNVHNILNRISQEDAANFLSRNRYFHEKVQSKDKHDHKEGSSCCGEQSLGRIYIPEEHQTVKERILHEHLAVYKIKAELPTLLTFLSDRFNSIKQKGASQAGGASFKMSPEEEAYVLREVMKEGVQFYFERKLRAALLSEAKSTSTEHALVANPSQWPKIFKHISLSQFDEPTMRWMAQGPQSTNRAALKLKSWFSRDLMETLNTNLQLLEQESKFERAYVNKIETKEKYMNFSLKQVPEKDLPALFTVCSVLSSAPFELNAKLKYGFQISEQYKAVMCGKSYEYSHKRDGVPDPTKDGGVCLTIIVNGDTDPVSQGPTYTLEWQEVGNTGKPATLPVHPGEMVILRSRYAGEYSLHMHKDKKQSLLLYWVNGPFDLHNRVF